jgi:hypothetical protein
MDNADNGNGDERLPVSLISFDAHVVDDRVELTWSTADEENNDYFTIERSLDGFDFNPLMTVDGAGDSDTRLDYQAIDHFPLEGRSYYRLKQTDHSGDFSYSSVKSVLVAERDAIVSLVKNPVVPGEKIELIGTEGRDDMILKIINLQGVEIASHRIFDLKRDGLHINSSGIYFLHLYQTNRLQIIKLLVN